jgi:NAD(P)-dependent dehydrogenase (short-subunit alcohol dehydrogenase family)
LVGFPTAATSANSVDIGRVAIPGQVASGRHPPLPCVLHQPYVGKQRLQTGQCAPDKPQFAGSARSTGLNHCADFGIYVSMASSKKIALITGANRGLGFEMARQLGLAGVKVLLAARDPKKGEGAAAKLRSEGLDAQFLKLDVTDKRDRAAAYAFLEEKFGRLDILINNAGVSADPLGAGKASTTTEDTIHRTFDTNFFAPVALTLALLPLLRKSEGGRIVNMSSILGSQTLHADPKSPIYDLKSLSYDASKAALNSFTIHLAHELRDTKIKVNSAHPGWVKTDMGTDAAPMEIPEGAKTGVELALSGDDGPTGGFFHLGKTLPW